MSISAPAVPAAPALQDRIVIRDGRVVKIEEYTNWNGNPAGGWFDVTRHAGGAFRSNIGCDEHGGGQSTGTLQTVLESIHAELRQPYIDLFGLTGLTPANAEKEVCRLMTRRAGRYEILFE